MNKQTDIAKARILWERAKREEAQKIPELERQIAQLRRATEDAGQALGRALEANGQCRICEQPIAQCDGHTLIGG